MKTSYPTIKKISALLLAIVFAGAINAQKGDYAASTKAQESYSSGRLTLAPAVRIMTRSEKKIVLSWAPFGEGVSHYVLERSGDGRHYEEAGVFFTGDGNDEPHYVYTDNLRRAYAGPLYYRLRVVGLDGTEVYTSASISGAGELVNQSHKQ